MIRNIVNFKNEMINVSSLDYRQSTISFHDKPDGKPMLEIRDNAFYVRGVPVPIDENEAGEVYKAFHQWLTWAWLSHDDNR